MPLEAENPLGRWSEALTREPGNLPSAIVTRRCVGRGASMQYDELVTDAMGEGNETAAAVTVRRSPLDFSKWTISMRVDILRRGVRALDDGF